MEEKNFEYAGVSAAPNAGILCYPVISAGICGDSESFKMLLGEVENPEELEYVSLEKQVTEKTPPCFIWQTATDELVPVENSYLMAQALKEKGVPYAHHVFSQGKHGLSLADQDWAEENYGKPYTMEQVFKLVEQVRNGAVSCTDEEKKMLLAAFDYNDVDENISRFKCEPNREVQIWPELADCWMEEIFNKKRHMLRSSASAFGSSEV